MGYMEWNVNYKLYSHTYTNGKLSTMDSCEAEKCFLIQVCISGYPDRENSLVIYNKYSA